MFSLDSSPGFGFISQTAGVPEATGIRAGLSPFRLQAAAWLYGVEVSAPSASRILLLGCCEPSQLIAIAQSLPAADIVVIDLIAQKVEACQQQTEACGIRNVQLFCAGLDELLKSEPGLFDFVVIHGLFTLVDDETRQAVLTFCQQHLTEQGVIGFEWNTQPGSQTAQILQDAIALHTSRVDDPQQLLASARAALTWLSLGMSQHPQRANLLELIRAAEAMDDDTFTLRYLQNINHSDYLVDFNQCAVRAGLSYVGDAYPWLECPDHFGETVAEINQTICSPDDKVLFQQYLDVAVCRQTRFSLLVSTAREAAITSLPDLARLRDFHWAGNFHREMNANGVVRNSFTTASGGFISTDNAVALSVLDVIGEAWPLSVNFEQLCFHTRSPEADKAKHEVELLNALEALFKQGSTGLHFQLLASGYNEVTSVGIGSFMEGYVSQLKAGINLWQEPVALTVQEVSVIEKRSYAFADIKLLEGLRRKGVLIANAESWRHHFQSLITEVSVDELAPVVMPLILFSTSVKQGGFCSTPVLPRIKNSDAGQIKPMPQKNLDRMYGMITAGEYEQAREVALELVRQHPENPNAWLELSRVYSRTRQNSSAIQAIVRSLAIIPANWDIYFELAITAWHLDRQWLTGRLVRAILSVNPQHALSWDVLGRLYTEHDAFTSGEICFDNALRLMPRNSGMLANLANLKAEQACIEESIALFRRAIKESPQEFDYDTSLMFSLAHSTEITTQQLYQEHVKTGRKYEAWARKQNVRFTWPQSKDPQRCLKVGFVSGDLCRHPVSGFVKPFWQALNRDRHELYVYHTSPLYDQVSQFFEESATEWKNVSQISDVELARVINADEIDILIDLSGYTAYNRLTTFSLKPTPLSISWIGYPGTTGIPTMDYHICGTGLATEGELEDQFSEALIYMQMPVQFEPDKNSPEVNTLPALKGKGFTFGSLNRPKKINDSVLQLWARILVAAPESRMLIGYMPGEEVSAILRKKLESYGVKPEQLIFRNKTHLMEYMLMHHEIDLMLDTFPYTGGTTSNNAMWMGVPTITLNGETMAARQGAEIMKAYRHEQFIVINEEDYFQQAIGWLNRLDELNEIRMAMREQFNSDKKDNFDASLGLEKTLRAIWQRYCAGEEPATMTIEI
ncbi:bifunctional class I SAM-dependent methyltransferase/glycosyltransferase [Enterobacter sp. CC120223-11]|uniref:bifunctional class I SAM-dependent methyltransferase/glycosyltransferase n=1 Tax=Enterobacter sp. CC120223-11 TaxID=1378073 RepID=UPI000BD2582C|nr:bifunctional class I SAM-dependent methyltransferase/glycosyltransferase [Enterobacter sp. CC120223-11]SNY79663.1 Predicted O-linked N-acetylglucosamine transferase, SPINDLY family [Enterobacter sp. CC120223-11]